MMDILMSETCWAHKRWNKIASDIKLVFHSSAVYANFETALQNAVTTVWPGLEVKACRFHLGQSWWRKMHSLGLSKQYEEKNSELSQFLKNIFGLSPLPPATVCDCFTLEFLYNLPNESEWNCFACSHVLMNFRGFPPACGDRVADFWGWDAHEARLRCPDDTRRGLKLNPLAPELFFF